MTPKPGAFELDRTMMAPNQRLQPTAPGGILGAPRLNHGRYAAAQLATR